jgi:hypothetical protein
MSVMVIITIVVFVLIAKGQAVLGTRVRWAPGTVSHR